MFGKGKVELLGKTTIYGVSIDTLTPGSHAKVLVRCTRCSEEFSREFRYLYQLHNCPTFRTINGIRHKWCNKCQLFKATDCFHTNQARYDGFQSQCMACLQNVGATSTRVAKLRQKRKTFEGWIELFYCNKRCFCRKHDIYFDLTTDFLKDQWSNQNGCCFYSKIPLKFSSTSLVGAQLDRIIPQKGYVKDNVVWCSKAVNSLKSNASIQEFTDFLTGAFFNIPIRCEFMKLDNRAKMPERKRATDAGLDVYAIEDCIIPPNTTATLRTGLALVVPPGYYYTIEGRSGFWKHGIVPCRGIIDATYSGEVMIAICNHNQLNEFTIKQNERFAQLIMHRFVPVDIIEVESIDDSYSDRGAAGFGSSGVLGFDLDVQKQI